MQKNHLLLWWLSLLFNGFVVHHVSADESVTLNDFNSLPVLQKHSIRITEFQAVDGLYLLNGTRQNKRGATVPVSLTVSKDLKYSFFGRTHDNQSGRNLYIRKPLTGYKDQTSFTQGYGPKAYFIFTDTECPYCSKMEHALDSLSLQDRVSLHYYLYPLRKKAQSTAKNHFILAQSEDKTRLMAMRNIMLRQDQAYRQQPISSVQQQQFDTHLQKVRDIALKLTVRGTPTIFNEKGERFSYKLFLQELELD